MWLLRSPFRPRPVGLQRLFIYATSEIFHCRKFQISFSTFLVSFWYVLPAKLPLLILRLSHLNTNAPGPVFEFRFRCAIESGIDEDTANFVLPLGGTVNMDGSAIYYPITVLFLAGLRGIDHYDFGNQILIALISAIVSIGSAPVCLFVPIYETKPLKCFSKIQKFLLIYGNRSF